MRVFAPAEVGVRVQVPAVTVPTQFTVPSLTVTFPVGVPPGDVTVNPTDTPCPTSDGSGVWSVIAVVVPAALKSIGPEVTAVSVPLSKRNVELPTGPLIARPRNDAA